MQLPSPAPPRQKVQTASWPLRFYVPRQTASRFLTTCTKQQPEKSTSWCTNAAQLARGRLEWLHGARGPSESESDGSISFSTIAHGGCITGTVHVRVNVRSVSLKPRQSNCRPNQHRTDSPDLRIELPVLLTRGHFPAAIAQQRVRSCCWQWRSKHAANQKSQARQQDESTSRN